MHSSISLPGRIAASAQAFARLYAEELGRKYSGLKADLSAEHASPTNSSDGTIEQVYSTNEGPVLITTRGKLVFVAESFDLPVARKLTSMILDAQGSGALQMASVHQSSVRLAPTASASPVTRDSLSASMVRFLSKYGIMKAVVDATTKAGRANPPSKAPLTP